MSTPVSGDNAGSPSLVMTEKRKRSSPTAVCALMNTGVSGWSVCGPTAHLSAVPPERPHATTAKAISNTDAIRRRERSTGRGYRRVPRGLGGCAAPERSEHEGSARLRIWLYGRAPPFHAGPQSHNLVSRDQHSSGAIPARLDVGVRAADQAAHHRVAAGHDGAGHGGCPPRRARRVGHGDDGDRRRPG